MEQQIQVYRANYQGKIITPEERETVYKATYEAPDKEGNVEYEVQATATYIEKAVPVFNYVLTAIIILLLLALLYLVLFWIAKHKKDKEDRNN